MSSDSESSEYEESNVEVEGIPCVFCEEILENDHVFIEHCSAQHFVDLNRIFGKLGDVFHVIKAINYLRKHRPTPYEFNLLANETPHVWDSEIYLEPTVPNDPLLLVDFDHLHDGDPRGAHGGDDVAFLKEQLELAHQRIAQMQKTARILLDGNSSHAGDGKVDLSVEGLKLTEDSGYIDSYSQVQIHQQMLQDVHRTESYRDAIACNRSLFEGKDCLDVGCGTSILSMFLARQGGARKVTGVDFSEIIYSAMDIVRENQLENVIDLKKGKLEELTLEPVDVIVSEWMGYFLLYESMLDSVIAARDKYLKPGGTLLPNKANLYLTITDDPELYDRHIVYWGNVYGFKMSCMCKPAISDCLIHQCRPELLCGSTALIKHFDLNTVTVEETSYFKTLFEISSTRETTATAIVGFFDTVFDLPNEVVLTTSPHEIPTHWKQTVFLLPEPVELAENGKLVGTIEVKRSRKDRRGLEVNIRLADGPLLQYNV